MCLCRSSCGSGSPSRDRSPVRCAEAARSLPPGAKSPDVLDGTAPADANHPYGYGRAAFFWSLVSALGEIARARRSC
jgi:hypothetical protein